MFVSFCILSTKEGGWELYETVEWARKSGK